MRVTRRRFKIDLTVRAAWLLVPRLFIIFCRYDFACLCLMRILDGVLFLVDMVGVVLTLL